MRGRLSALAVVAWFAASGQADGQDARGAGRGGWIGIRVDLPLGGIESGPLEIVVIDVHRGGPADVAGIRPGDTLSPGRPLADYDAWVRALAGPVPGDTIGLMLRRNGENRLVFVLAGRRPTTAQAAPAARYEHVRNRVFKTTDSLLADALLMESASFGWTDSALALQASRGAPVQVPWGLLPEFMRAAWRDLGINPAAVPAFGPAEDAAPRVYVTTGAELRDLTRALGKHFGVSEGVLATNVTPGSPAGRAGLRAGDVVVSVGGEPISTVAQLRTALVAASDPVGVDLVRRGERISLSPPLR